MLYTLRDLLSDLLGKPFATDFGNRNTAAFQHFDMHMCETGTVTYPVIDEVHQELHQHKPSMCDECWCSPFHSDCIFQASLISTMHEIQDGV